MTRSETTPENEGRIGGVAIVTRNTRARRHRICSFGIRPFFGLRGSVFGFPYLTLLLTITLFAALSGIGAEAQPKPLTRLHAHNDYEHKRPLFDAVEHGFCSVEADIHLVNGELLVAHSRSQIKPERTLQKLYLDPLKERIQLNGGHVFRDGPQFTLLIDIKTDWKSTYPVLRDVLKKYAGMFTTFREGKTETNALLAIITGNRSKDMFAGENIRYAGLDGELEDLDSSSPATLIPWISSNWTGKFQWRGSGPMPELEKKRLKEIVERAHQQGRRVRFWGAPDFAAFWRELLADGVDLINTDDLEGAQHFLEQQR